MKWTEKFMTEANAKYVDEMKELVGNDTFLYSIPRIQEAFQEVFQMKMNRERKVIEKGITVALHETVDNMVKELYHEKGLFDWDKDDDMYEVKFIIFQENDEQRSLSFTIKGFTNAVVQFTEAAIMEEGEALEQVLADVMRQQKIS